VRSTVLGLSVTHWRNVGPDVSKVDSVRVELIPVAAVVLDVAAAVAAGLYGQAWPSETLGLALRVVEQAVMRRVESAWDWQAHFEVHRDPVSEHHPGVVQEVPELDVPPWDVVEPDGSTRLHDAGALLDPRLAPGEVLLVLETVVDALAVVLVQIERWVREHQVHGLVFDLRQPLQTVALEELPEIGLKDRLHLL